MIHLPRRLLAFSTCSVLLLVSLTGGGCSRSLFRDSSRARNNIDKYYEGDSASAATANRQRSSQMGFGFPTGPN